MKKEEELFFLRHPDPEKQKKLHERELLAYDLIKAGQIGVIKEVTETLEGKFVMCIGGQYPPEITLRIEQVNIDKEEVEIYAGEKNEKKWVPIKDLRLLSAVTDFVNHLQEDDEHVS